MDNRALEAFLQNEGYYNIRFIDDSCIANYRFLYTTAVVIGIDQYGYETRHCYADKSLAEKACLEMKTLNDKPLKGVTAIKGRFIDVNGDDVLNYV